MTRLGPRTGPTAGPRQGPNAAVGGGDDPLVGYSSAFTVVAGDSFVVLAVAGPTFLDGPFRLSTTGSLPTGLLAGTDYWIADSFTGDSQTFQISDSLANAMTATYVAIDVDDGTGTHTITYVG